MDTKLRFLILISLVSIAVDGYSQAPTLSYSTPLSFTAGVTITPQAPTSTGVAARGYSSTLETIGSGFHGPTGLTLDRARNLYVADNGGTTIQKFPAGTNNSVSIGSGFSSPDGVVVDGAGNTYVAQEGNSEVTEIPFVGGSAVNLGSGFKNPVGLALDGAGDLFIADMGNNSIEELLSGTTTPIVLGSGFKNPTGVAVDALGNVYVADEGNSVVKEIPAGNGTPVAIGTGFSNPFGVAVDGAGNVYVTDLGNNALKEILAGSGTTITVTSSLNEPTGVALDNLGNLYVANGGDGTIKEITPNGGYFLPVALPPGLSFNINTGVISGMPTLITGAANYTVLAYNATGSASSTINIQVVAGVQPTVSYTGPQTYQAGVAITPLVPISSGVAAPPKPYGGFYISPGLPAGLSIDVTTGAISGTPTVLSPATNYNITAYSFGISVTTTLNITVVLPPITYASPQVYLAGTAISPLEPAGNRVYPPAYGSLSTLTSGLGGTQAVAVDAEGNVYVADYVNSIIKELPAGNGEPITLGSGFNHPQGVAVDGAGNVYVIDLSSNVKKIPAGNGPPVTIGSGFTSPIGIAADNAGNVYVSDEISKTVTKIPAGNGTQVTIGSGFTSPIGVAVDGIGNVYVADDGNNAIKKIAVGSNVPVIIGSGFSNPTGVAVDGAGNVYVDDSGNSAIKKIVGGNETPVTLVLGFYQDGVAVDAVGNIYLTHGTVIDELAPSSGYYLSTTLPQGLNFDGSTGIISGTPTALSPPKNYLVTAYNLGGNTQATVNIAVRTVAPATINYTSPQTFTIGAAINPLTPVTTGVNTLAYSSSKSTLGSGFSFPWGIAADASGNVYVADESNNAIKEILASNGTVITLPSAGFSTPAGIAIDASGNVYVADLGNDAIKEIPVVGGNPVTIASGFNDPTGVAVDAKGNIYVADRGNNALKEIISGGNTAVTVGSFAQPTDVAVDAGGNLFVLQLDGYIYEMPSGGGTTVLLASGFSNTDGIALDAADDIYVSESIGDVKEILQNGTVVTVANGFFNNLGVTVDGVGNVYISDSGNAAVREVSPVGGYDLKRALPVGLSFDATTGTITGTPTISSPSTNYTVTAYNAGGGTAANLNITVLATANLSSLSISAGTLSPAFTAGTLGYSASVPYVASQITVTPASADPDATITVNGATVTSGSASGNITLLVGANTISVVVTGRDGVTRQTYTLSITRAPSGNATLSSITLNHGTLTPTFAAATFSYMATVPYTTTSVTLKPLAGNASATIKVNGVVVTSNTPSGAVALNVGGNTISTTVTAPDGVTMDTYTVTVTRLAISSNAALAGIIPNKGSLSPAFATATNNYTVMETNGITSVAITPTAADPTATIKVDGTTVASGASSAAIALAVGTNTITILVTAQDGVTTDTYTLNVIRPSTNAKLSNLAISSGTLSPVFNTNTTSYTASVPGATTAISVTPTVSAAGASVLINGLAVSSGNSSGNIALAFGATTITTVVTAQDGVTTFTYTLTVTRALSSDASLANIVLNKGALSPAFSSTTNTYTDMVTNGTAAVTLTPTVQDNTATVTVNGNTVASGSASGSLALAVGSNIETVVVTAQDGVTTQTYNVNVIRPSTNAKLSALTISAGTLAPAFNANTTAYTTAQLYAISSITLTPTVAVAGASVKVNGIAVASGAASGAIALAVGSNTITIVVTAQDGITTDTYTITVTRTAESTNDNLSALTVSKGTLTPAFSTATTTYTDMVTNSTASVTLTPTASNTAASIIVNGTAVVSGKASGSITLSVGSNNVSVMVTAQDGVTKQTYTVNVIRPSTNAKLSNLTTNAGTVTPVFNPAATSYTLSVTNATSSIIVTPTVAVMGATVKVNGTVVASGSPSAAIALAVGSNTITTIVTAQDGVTTDTYTLTVTRAVSGANNVYEPIGTRVQNFEPSLADDGINVHQGVSPNGDGINDYLQIDNISNYPDNNLKIMTRNGLLIFEAKGYDNATKVFDGHSNKNGQMQLPGTYFYELYYIANGVTKHKTGYLLLKY